MAVYSANNPSKIVTLHKEHCSKIPRGKLMVCGCGDTSDQGNHHWYCEEHITRNEVDQFMNGRFWALRICDICYGEL